MGFYNSPRIILDNLVLNLDAGNTKSYAGDTPTTAGTPYGYFGGGFPGPGALSTVERIDYSSDTTACATKGPLSNSVYFSGGTGSLSYGYIAGGYPSGGTTNNRIDYSNDTATAAEKGPLTAVIQYIAAAGNTSYGYFGSGRQSPGGIFTSKVDRLDYSSDASTMLARGPLVASHNYRMVTGNLSYGYWAGGGGNGPPAISSVDRLDYSNDTTTAVAKGPLNAARYKGSATGNGDYGYYAGGQPSPYKSLIERIDYSNDTPTAASGKGPLNVGTTNMHDSATGTDDYGYWAGGYKAYGLLSFVQRLDYSSDTSTASPKGDLSVAKRCVSAVGSRAYGFPTTGAPATRTATQTVGTPYGYFGGGEVISYSTIIERLDFSSDTDTAVVKGPLSAAKRSLAATGNTDYGYWVGGYAPGRSSTVDRVDYSNDTATAAPKGNLSIGHVEYSATGTSSYGYFGAGEGAPGAIISIVDRIDYSNDTSTAVAKGPLSIAKEKFGSTGNASYGYMAGGKNHPNYYSTIDRIDYSSDTSTALAKGPLSGTNYLNAATGNASYGYWGGGKVPSNTTITQRLDYSSDTTTASAKGPLSNCQYYMGATGNTSYGYWGSGSGQPGANVTTVDRLDYSSDGTACSPKGPLTIQRIALAAASPRANALPGPATIYPWYDTSGKGDDGNNTSGGARFSSAGSGSFTFNGSSNYVSSDDKANLQLGSGNFTLAAWIKPGSSAGPAYGYIGGGAPSPSGKSGIDRIDYSNDTATAAAKGPLSLGRMNLGATGNASYGYWGGGMIADPSDRSTVDRLDYSSDTTTAAAKGPLTLARNRLAATGNTSYGYWCGGGYSTPAKTTVDRVDYSSDTPTASPKGPLSAGRYGVAATGNQSYGYVAGGRPNPAKTTVDRIDYSSDTGTTPAKGPLSVGTFYFSATGNASYGYFASGSVGTNIDRIDYGNDTATASPKGPLSTPSSTYNFSATGDTSYGYFAGGEPGPGAISTIDRIDYSNDTATASPKGSLSVAKYTAAGASGRANGIPLHSDNEGIISYSDTAGEENDTTCQFHLNNDGKIRFSGAAGIVTSTSAVTADTWAHAAVTRTDNMISVYVNGVLENTGITTHTFSDYAKVTIGANRPRSTFYKGDISQVQIYKKSLSSNEIQQNFRSLKKRFGL